MAKYEIIKDKIEVDGQLMTRYGITNKEETIKDITCNYDTISALLLLLTENNVSEIHFRDVVEDFLANQ